VAFLLVDPEICFTVLFYKHSCVYTLFFSVNILCKIVLMSICFATRNLNSLSLFLSILQQTCVVMCIHKTPYFCPQHRSYH
jgi:hypothetical protein